MLELALVTAKKAHANQVGKAGEPYMNHLLAVANGVDNIEQKKALLHDICEDADTTPNDLIKLGFTQTITNSVILLTKTLNETYDEY